VPHDPSSGQPPPDALATADALDLARLAKIMERRKEALDEIGPDLPVGGGVKSFVAHRLGGNVDGGHRALHPQRIVDAPGYLVAPEVGRPDRDTALGRDVCRLDLIQP